MAAIDPLSCVEDGAVIGEGTVIGPFCHIGPNVTIGPNCRVIGHVTMTNHTTIGADCTVHPFAVLGGPPQDLSYRGEPTRLQIGSGCTIREGTTMNIGTKKGGGLTKIGDRGFFMNNSHVAHDCIVGNDVILATSATLGGHCEIGDFVYLGGLSAVHQFTRIGSQVMVGGVCGVSDDIIPYAIVSDQRAKLRGLNLVGLKRRQFSRERLATVHRFYRTLFHGTGSFSERLKQVASMGQDDPAIADILTFIQAGKNRKLCMPRYHADA